MCKQTPQVKINPQKPVDDYFFFFASNLDTTHTDGPSGHRRREPLAGTGGLGRGEDSGNFLNVLGHTKKTGHTMPLGQFRFTGHSRAGSPQRASEPGKSHSFSVPGDLTLSGQDRNWSLASPWTRLGLLTSSSKPGGRARSALPGPGAAPPPQPRAGRRRAVT